MVITRINPLSCAKVSGLVYALLGFVFGAFFSLFMMMIGSSLPSDEAPFGQLFGALFGVGAIVVLPIFYGVMGFVGGAIAAFAYNLVAGWTGGLEVDVQQAN